MPHSRSGAPMPYPQWGQQPPHYRGPGLPPPGWSEWTQPIPAVIPALPPNGFPPPSPPPLPGYQPPRGPRRWPWVVAGGATLLAAIVVGLGFALGWFIYPVFDRTAVQNGVRGVLTTSYALTDVSTVTCPADQPVEPGASFDCVATVGGQPKTVHVQVLTVAGDYSVGMP